MLFYQSHVNFLSKLDIATAIPWIMLNGDQMSRLYTYFDAFPNIIQYLDSSSFSSDITKFFILDYTALPWKFKIQAFDFSFHFALLLTHLIILERSFSHQKPQSIYSQGRVFCGRQICIFLGPRSPSKLVSQHMVTLLKTYPFLNRLYLLPKIVDYNMAILVYLKDSFSLSYRKQKLNVHMPYFLTVITCFIFFQKQMLNQRFPSEFFLSLRIMHLTRFPFSIFENKFKLLPQQFISQIFFSEPTARLNFVKSQRLYIFFEEISLFSVQSSNFNRFTLLKFDKLILASIIFSLFFSLILLYDWFGFMLSSSNQSKLISITFLGLILTCYTTDLLVYISSSIQEISQTKADLFYDTQCGDDYCYTNVIFGLFAVNWIFLPRISLVFLISFKGLTALLYVFVDSWNQLSQKLLIKFGTYLEIYLFFIFQNQFTCNNLIYNFYIGKGQSKKKKIYGQFQKMIYFQLMVNFYGRFFIITCQVIMLQQKPKKFTLVLLIFCTISLCCSLGMTGYMVFRKYYGFGITYSTEKYCTTYQYIKYQPNKQISYSIRFVLIVISSAILLAQTIYLIKRHVQDLRRKETDQNVEQWSQKQLVQSYIALSLTILSVLPALIYYCSVFVELSACFGLIYLDWLILGTLAVIIVILSLIGCIMTVRESWNSTQDDQKVKDISDDIENEQRILKNIFRKQISEHYKSIKEDANNESDYPLLHKINVNNLTQQNRQYIQQKLNIYTQKIINNQNEQKQSKKMTYSFTSNKDKQQKYQNNKHHNQSNLSSQPNPYHHSQKRTSMIEKYKAKFKEINPNKLQAKNKEHQLQEVYDIPEEHYQIKHYPKTYNQLIKQNKKPIRMPTHVVHIPFIEEESSQYDQISPSEDNQQPNPPQQTNPAQDHNVPESSNIKVDHLLNQINLSGTEPIVKDNVEYLIMKRIASKTDEIVFKNGDNARKRIKKMKRKIALKNAQQPELFYHKPGTNTILNKPRKKLFDEDLNMQNTSESKDPIINKMKIAKNIEQKNQLLQKQKKRQSQPNKKLTKSEKLMEFLRSKYNYQKEKSANLGGEGEQAFFYQ